MLHTIKALLAEHGITLVAPISLDHCRITRPYLLDRAGIGAGTAFMLAIPYYTTSCDDSARNISVYAVSADYHLFLARLFEAIRRPLQEAFPANRFAFFGDHSPIAEVEAAARAGLGVIGKNHLLLTREHSSFVFLAEIITDAPLVLPRGEIGGCTDCGACLAACPVSLDPARCLSALTQKKGALTREETDALLAHELCWGCDRCQTVCPFTEAARRNGTLCTPIAFFRNTAKPSITAAEVTEMEEAAFAARAYSWRGRETILRNLTIKEGKETTP